MEILEAFGDLSSDRAPADVTDTHPFPIWKGISRSLGLTGLLISEPK